MKNIQSKILSLLLLFILTFNFIIMFGIKNEVRASEQPTPNPTPSPSQAAGLSDTQAAEITASHTTSSSSSDDETLDDISKGTSKEDIKSLFDNGTVSSDSEGKKQNDSVKETSTSFDMVGTITASIFMLFPKICSLIMSGVASGNEKNVFTIQDLLSGNYDIFDINVFNTNTSGVHKDSLKKIRENIAIWYVSLRNIAIVGTTIILIYIGIRMPLAVLSTDKAKYKKMFINWLAGFVLIWLMQYIAMFLINISNIFVQLIAKAMQNEGVKGIESKIVNNVFSNIASQSNANGKIFYLIMYYGFVFYEIKFFIIYFSRMIKICFYVMIAPLVCMTYSIDKLKDNKAQGFITWFKDMVSEIFKQPIQLLLYTIFIYSAGEIIGKAPLIGLIFLALLSHGEQIVKKALNIGGKGKGLKDTKIPFLHI